MGKFRRFRDKIKAGGKKVFDGLKKKLRRTAKAEEAKAVRAEKRIEEKEIEANGIEKIPHAVVLTRFARLFPEGIKTIAIRKDHRNLLGVGGKILVFRAGHFTDSAGKQRWLALKVCRYPDAWIKREKAIADGHEERHGMVIGGGELPFGFFRREKFEDYFFVSHRHSPIWLYLEKENFKVMRKLGIPTIEFGELIKTNPEPVMETAVLPVEDLSEGGVKIVRDFFAIDRRSLLNYAELRGQFKTYRDRLLEAGTELSKLAKESADTSLHEELAKCFFVVIDRKTKEGKLVVGTASGIMFPENAYDLGLKQ